MTRSNWLIALVVVAAMTGAVNASATLDMYAYVTGIQTNGTGALVSIAPTQTITTFVSATTVYRVDVAVKLTNTDPNFCLGNISFDLNEGASGLLVPGTHVKNVTTAGLSGWKGDNSQFTYHSDPFDPSVTATEKVWSTNADKGPSLTDLLSITVVVDQAAIAPLGNPGEDPRLLLGSPSDPGLNAQGNRFAGRIYVTWDGTLGNEVTVNGAPGTPWSLMNVTTGAYVGQSAATLITHNPIRFGAAIPEPATLTLLGIGGLLALKRRRN